jgi:FixJ family two-component response regulator
MTSHPKPGTQVSTDAQALIYVVDDDPDLREALSSLFRSVGLPVSLFGSAADFLDAKLAEAPSCLVLDVRLPGISGLDFQSSLANAGIHMPIVFMTGHADIPMSVRAMKAGAVDFLTKPFRDQDMLDAVFAALDVDRKRRDQRASVAGLNELYQSLTSREKEVMAYVTQGLMNKQIAGALGLSEITVKIHRGHAMRKMGARSVADLVKISQRLGLAGTPQ